MASAPQIVFHNIVDKLAVRIGSDGVFLSLLGNVHIVEICDDIGEDTETEASEIGEKVDIAGGFLFHEQFTNSIKFF